MTFFFFCCFLSNHFRTLKKRRRSQMVFSLFLHLTFDSSSYCKSRRSVSEFRFLKNRGFQPPLRVATHHTLGTIWNRVFQHCVATLFHVSNIIKASDTIKYGSRVEKPCFFSPFHHICLSLFSFLFSIYHFLRFSFFVQNIFLLKTITLALIIFVTILIVRFKLYAQYSKLTLFFWTNSKRSFFCFRHHPSHHFLSKCAAHSENVTRKKQKRILKMLLYGKGDRDRQKDS